MDGLASNISPPSSPLRVELSPTSSPSPSRSPPIKRRKWQVFDAVNSRTKSTAARWEAIGVEMMEEVPIEATSPNHLVFYEQCNVDQDISEDHSSVDSVSEFDSSTSPSAESEGSSNESELCPSSSNSECDVPEEVECSLDSSAESCPASDSDSDKEDFFELYSGCDFSVDEAVLDILTDSIKNRETQESLKCHFQTLLKYLPKRNNMPKTYSQLTNHVLRLVPDYFEKPVPYCGECLLLLDSENRCPVASCESEKVSNFYMFSLKDQIRFFFEHGNLASFLKQREASDGVIRDITDGSQYIKVKVKGEFSITLMIYTDGVTIRKSSKTKFWPLMVVICEVPPHIRHRFIIICGIWCDTRDAPMNTFLQPIVELVNEIDSEGGVLWKHPDSGEECRSVVRAPVICADAPARAKIQNLISHNGNFGCNTCEQTMEKIPLTRQELRLKRRGVKVTRKRGFMFKEIPATLRTDERMRRQARIAFNTQKPCLGVKGPTIVSCLPDLDTARCVFSEYMHGVCLGVVKRFLNLWLTVPGPWNISHFVNDMDNFMQSTAPPSDITRLPRNVSDFKYWKASEFRHWLLFYSLPCISGKLPNQYVKHWSLLVLAVYLLLQEEITRQDLKNARLLLRAFVKDVGRLYRQRDNTYNVHQLLHLDLYVKWWGPLWCTAAFSLEGCNGDVVNLTHGTKNPGIELMRNIRLVHGVEILRSMVHTQRTVGNVPKDFIPVNNCTSVHFQEDEHVFLDHGLTNVTANNVYSCVKRGRDFFTSESYTRQRKRCNYIIKFKTSESSWAYGAIRYFISQSDGIFAVVKKFRIDHSRMFYIDNLRLAVKHILPIDVTEDIVLVKVNDIVTKVIRVHDTICLNPNRYEKYL
ncbi:uncharacterized protein LOC117642758 [Thrips palmi]|uniref:Uncharacterized protein LOC117642758 n=1 Tax=Thrips palmi TaxID=161013 RepID=A0A6P8YBZ2_THRPL|nr:uncharacterized protein LOC117642758 [Thrips palmi]